MDFLLPASAAYRNSYTQRLLGKYRILMKKATTTEVLNKAHVNILKRIGASPRLFTKTLLEVTGIFINCFLTQVLILLDFSILSGKTTYKNPVNLL